MALSRPFAYNNTGSPISGTTQYGDLSVGTPTSGFTTNPQYWNGPDENLGYVIAYPVSGGTHPTPISGVTAYLGFKGTKNMTNPLSASTFVELVNSSFNQSFTTGNQASAWLTNNGYWTSYPGLTNNISLQGFYFSGSIGAGYLATAEYPVDADISVNFTNILSTTGTPLTINSSVIIYSGLTTGYTQVFVNDNYNDLTNESIFTGITFSVTGTTSYGFSGESSGSTFNVTPTPTPTNTPTITLTGETATPTPTPTNTETPVAETPTNTPTNTETPTPTLTQTPVAETPTPTETETPTPTPSVTPEPVTGYSFNLIALPYNFPTTGNTIMTGPSGSSSGTTNPNEMTSIGRAIYFNSIDSDGIDRTSYFSQFTGQSITITMSQTGSTAIYSGDTNAFKYWSANTGTPPGVAGDGFVFGTGISVPPITGFTGTTVLIQSATTNWTVGLPVYISAEINAGVTPTPTSTSTNTPTPSITASQTLTPTPTLTQTPTDLSTITTYTISGCSSSNVIVADLGPGGFFPGDTFYLDFTGSTATECYTILNKINATPTDGSNPISSYPNCADCIGATTTTYTISGCTNLNVLVADLGAGAFASGDIYNMTFTGATPSGCYRIVNKIVATPTDTGAPLTFHINCDDCEASLPTPTPTPTNTPTNTETPTNTPTNTETPTNTPTPTITETPSGTPSETPTNTPTPTTTDLTSVTTFTISGCTNLNVLVADLGPSSLAPGDVFNLTFTGGTPSGCYRIVEKTVATPTDGATPLLFYVNCAACQATLVTPTPTNTKTPTVTPTNTATPSSTPTETPTNTPTQTTTQTSTLTPSPTPTDPLDGGLYEVSTSPDAVCYGTSPTTTIYVQGTIDINELIYQNNAGTDPYTISELQTLTSTLATTFYFQSVSGGTVYTITDNGSGQAECTSIDVCPTPTPTPTVTSTATPTPTNTLTPTNTPSVTPNYNLTFTNGSTICEIQAFQDDLGLVPLTGATQSFPINQGQTLRAIHGTTSTFPSVYVTGTGSINWQFFINGVFNGFGSVVLPDILQFTFEGTPILASENIVLEIIDTPG